MACVTTFARFLRLRCAHTSSRMAKRAPGKAPGGPRRQQGATAQKGKGVVKVQKRPVLPVKLGGGKGPIREWDKGKPGVGGGKPKPGPVRKPGVPAAPAAGAKGRHTILLQQATGAAGTRTWHDFDSTPQVGRAHPALRSCFSPSLAAALAQALDFFTSGYEKELRKLNPATAQLSYTVAGERTPGSECDLFLLLFRSMHATRSRTRRRSACVRRLVARPFHPSG